MVFSYLIYFWVAVALTICTADAASDGTKRSTCRQTSVMQNFNITGILGQWYKYSSLNHDFEEGCDCFTSEIVALDAKSIQISNCCQKTKVSNESQTCSIGVNYARLTNPEKMDASFMYTRTGVTAESRVWIVDTDYVNYSIISGCDKANEEEEREIFWILSRDKEINATEAKKIEEVLKANNFERNKISRHRHGANICKSRRPQRRPGGSSSGGHKEKGTLV